MEEFECKTGALPDIPDEVPVAEYTKYWLPAGVYDALKWLSCLGIPAAGTFYVAVAAALGLPGGEQVSAVCLAASAFLGALIGASEATKTKTKAKR